LPSRTRGGGREGRKAEKEEEEEEWGEDECDVVGGAWEWQPHSCRLPRASERDCEACWGGLRRARFAGDSNCRDIYIEAASCALGDWDPELPVARQASSLRPHTLIAYGRMHY
jgi:hypothetical protein